MNTLLVQHTEAKFGANLPGPDEKRTVPPRFDNEGEARSLMIPLCRNDRKTVAGLKFVRVSQLTYDRHENNKDGMKR